MRTLRQPVQMPVIGLSSGRPGEFIDQRATPDCQNVEFSRFTIAKRIGEAQLGLTSSERILAVGELHTGTARHVFRIGLSKFDEYVGSAWTARANAPLTATSAEIIDYTFPLLNASKILVYTDFVDNIRKWTGSGNDALLGGSPPKAKYVLALGPYLLLFNILDAGNNYYSRVQWCDTGAIETWSGGNAGAVDLIDDEQDITGAELFSTGVTVHKSNCIYVGYFVTTSAVFRFDRKNTGVGTVARGTIKNLPSGEQIFLAKDGIHTFNGVTAPLIQAEILEEIREGANPLYIYKSTAKLVAEKDEYWLAVPIGSQTEPQTIYKYNYRTGQVHKDKRANLTCFGEYQQQNQVTIDSVSTPIDAYTSRFDDILNLSLAPTVLFGHNDGTITQRTGIYTDNGGEIDGFWISKDFTADDYGLADPSIMIRWQGVEVWAKGTNLELSYSTDGGVTFTKVGTKALSGDYPSDASPLNFYFDVKSTRLRFKFRNAEGTGTFVLKQFIPLAIPGENRR